MNKRLISVVGLWLALTTAASAQPPLAWKFKEGDRFSVETVRKETETNKVADRTILLEKTTTSLDRYQVVKVDSEQVTMERKLEIIRFENHVKGIKDDETDAASSAQANQASEIIAQKLKGAVVTIVFDTHSRTLLKLQGFNIHIAKSLDQFPGRKQSLAAEYNDENLREDTELLLAAFLPEGPVSSGAKWKQNGKIPWGPVGGFAAEGNYTDRGKSASDPQYEQIDADWKLTYVAPAGGLHAAALPFKIKQANLEGSTAHGSYLFDGAAGRLRSHERELTVKSSIVVVASDKETEVNMPVDHRETYKARFFDQLPSK
jgi:hypothetical protein